MTYQAVEVEHLVAVVDDLGVLLGQPPGPSADGRRERGHEARDKKKELGDVESEDVGHEGGGGLSRLGVSACVAAQTGDCPIAEAQEKQQLTSYVLFARPTTMPLPSGYHHSLTCSALALILSRCSKT